MSLRSLARALGGDVAGRDPPRVLCPGPGHSARDRSLSVTFNGSSFITHSFANDDWRDCRDHVRQLLGMPDWQPGDEQDRRIRPDRVKAWDRAALDLEAEDRTRTEHELDQIEHARRLWDGAQEPRRTLAEAYLNSRGLKIGDHLANRVLRFHPRCPRRDENSGKTVFVPALVAAFTSIDDGEIVAVHRIFLSPDGTKLDRRMLGPVRRAAVMLDPAAGDSLVIGEGIETAMAARHLGMAPAWALGSVVAINTFPVIPHVRRLTILLEAGQASADAAGICRCRWERSGRPVTLWQPPAGCSDANDAILRKERRQ